MTNCPYCGAEADGADFFKRINPEDIPTVAGSENLNNSSFYLVECPDCNSVLGGSHHFTDDTY